MVLAKSKNAVGLGNSLMNDRFGKGKGQDMRRGNAGIQRTGIDGETYITNNKNEASWVKMRSITEQAALDEFLSTAQLAGTDFTAEKMNNVKIIHTDQKNPYLLSAAEERATVKKQNANKKRLTVPRRPPWDETTTRGQLHRKEREALLEWRRDLAELQESHDLLMTPFERNVEVWRQLWRVIERSDLVVQIVDARNPLLFRSEDLENYVKDVDPRKNNLLLVNKADMMTLEQRQAWADYFEEAGISYTFFSAELAKEMNEARDITDGDTDDLASEHQPLGVHEMPDAPPDDDVGLAGDASHVRLLDEDDYDEDEDKNEDEEGSTGTEQSDARPVANSVADKRTKILTTDELESLFLEHAPVIDGGLDHNQQPRKTQIGLVGYPNVGKSSTINALIGAKKVSVSATPGKTKHFQTIHLSEQVVLCDCPGLVFPNYGTTKAELVCNGILPIDQLREFTGPVGLVAQRIPKSFIEAIYSVKIHTRPLEEGGTGIPTADEILRAYAVSRGFATTGQGNPDVSRAARYILKDYVKGKLLFCQPPPREPPIDPEAFNHGLYDAAHLPQRRRLALSRREGHSAIGSEDASAIDGAGSLHALPVQGAKSSRLDKKFFAPGQGSAGHLTRPFQYKYSEQGMADSGKQLSGRKAKTMMALERDVDPAELRNVNGKKHFKGDKRKKGKEEYVD